MFLICGLYRCIQRNTRVRAVNIRKLMKRKMKQVIMLVASLMILAGFVSQPVFASTGKARAATFSACPYQSTHGQHSPHASNFDYKLYIYPDYTMGQMHMISFWMCKGCSYCCCALDEYFGDLITYDLDKNVDK